MPQARGVSFQLDGKPAATEAEPRRLLSDVLREDFGVRRVHVGCEQGVCGACTVLLDGEAVRSCLVLVAEVDGRSVDTFQGLSVGDAVQSLVARIVEHGGVQCGYCTPGIVTSLYAALRDGWTADSADHVRELLDGHLCRCTGYDGLVQALLALGAADEPESHQAGTVST